MAWKLWGMPELIIILAASWERLYEQDLDSLVGTGSNTHVEDFIPIITSLTASSDIITKDDIIDGVPWTGKSQGVWLSALVIAALIETIFSIKIEANSSQSGDEKLFWRLGAGQGFQRLSMVEKSTLALAKYFVYLEKILENWVCLSFLTALLSVNIWSLRMLKSTLSSVFLRRLSALRQFLFRCRWERVAGRQ